MSSNLARRFLFIVLPCLLLALTLLAYPLYVIRPFRAQGSRELMAALVLLRYRPAVMAILVLATLLAVIWYWRGEKRTLRRIVSSVSLLAVAAAAVLARVNVYELMFHPLDRPTFSAASGFALDGAEKVIAVKLGDVARAYPVRGMSYHHIVNDMLNGVPIAATY
jgi:hypothetical protein